MILDIWNIDQLPVGLLAQLVDALTLGVRVFPARVHLAHWQENTNNVKGEGGAVGLTENPSALRRWMVSGPELSRMIQ